MRHGGARRDISLGDGQSQGLSPEEQRCGMLRHRKKAGNGELNEEHETVLHRRVLCGLVVLGWS